MPVPALRRAKVALAVAAAALLAGCTVEVEGAPCAAAGDATDCPGGQACGNDRRCSARALACQASRCTPGVDGACLDPGGATTAIGVVARRCTDADPVCGALIEEPCAPAGLRCEVRAPAGGPAGPWCVCPPTAGRELTVGPEGSLADAPPFATGAASPPACGFRRLGHALAAAAAIAADPAAVATVTAVGAAAGATRTFSGAATGEAFPLVVAERVVLRSDAQAGGGAYELVFDAAGAATAPIELHSGSAISGFTVRNGAGDASRDAVALRCGGPDPAVLTSVVLEGMGATGVRLGRGVAAGATCSVVARNVEVRDMAVAGFLLDADPMDPAPVVTIAGGSVASCADGVVVRVGRLALDGARVEGNAGMGIRADDFDGIPRVEIRRSKIVRNGDTGIAIVSAPEVRITGTTIFGNGAITEWGGFPLGASRRAGGVVLWGTPPAAGSLEFGRNRLYANGGDQLLVLGAGTPWNLDGPTSCGSDAAGPLYSVTGCYDPTPVGTASFRGVVAINASVSARYFGWQTVTPSATNDVAGFSGTVTFTPFCSSDPTLSCESEDPVPP